MIYTWKPGTSWILRQSFDNYSGKTTEILMKGQEAAAVMLVMEQGYAYPEHGNLVGYSLKNVYIGYNALKLKTIYGCENKHFKYKDFDFEQQTNRMNEYTPQYQQEMRRISITYEKMVNNFRDLQNQMQNTEALKQLAMGYIRKLDQFETNLSENVKKIQDFRVNSLKKFQNSQLEDLLKSDTDGKSFKKNVESKYNGPAKLGTKNNPAIDCYALKVSDRSITSGFYYIKPECGTKELRVFCDFTVYGQAVDIHVFNDNSKLPNPNLSYLNIEDFMSIRFQCAKLGLYPIEVKNREMLQRVYDLLMAMGYDLSQSKGIPLGYDYTCKTNKCARVIKSLNNHLSEDIINFFSNPNSLDETIVKSGPFVGFGFSHEKYAQVSFGRATPISAIICSTNHFKTDLSDENILNLTCDMSILDSEKFKIGGRVIVRCPQGCISSSTKVYGNGFYHGTSSICKAALHNEVLPPSGGKIFVNIHGAMAKDYVYQENFASGIQTETKLGGDPISAFSIMKFNAQCPIDTFNNLRPEEKQLVDMLKQQHRSFLETSVQTGQEQNITEEDLEGLDANDIRDLYTQMGQRVPEGINLADSNPYENSMSDNENMIPGDGSLDRNIPESSEMDRLDGMLAQPNVSGDGLTDNTDIEMPLEEQNNKNINDSIDPTTNTGQYLDSMNDVNNMNLDIPQPASVDSLAMDISQESNVDSMNMDLTQQNYNPNMSQNSNEQSNTDQQNSDSMNPEIFQYTNGNQYDLTQQSNDQFNTSQDELNYNSDQYAFKENSANPLSGLPSPKLPAGFPMPPIPPKLPFSPKLPSTEPNASPGSKPTDFTKTFSNAANSAMQAGIFNIT
jgi:hypothetical protein